MSENINATEQEQERLAKALEFSNTMQTFNLAKNNLKVKTQNLLSQGREEPAKIKSCVNHWLPQFSYVLAFHSAQKMHGGLGATYILLSKSAASKQKTARQHQHRGNKS